MYRIDWIDWAKVILIMLVVLGHCQDLKYADFIYAFHIPAFFFISGYLANYKKKKTGTLKAALPMICAILIYNVLFIAINAMCVCLIGTDINGMPQSDTSFYELICRPILGIVWVRGNNNSFVNQLWFVWVLILLKCLYRYIYDRCPKFIPLILVACVSYCCLLNALGLKTVFYVDRCIMSLPFFMMGNLCKHYSCLKISKILSRKMGGVIGITFFLLIAIDVSRLYSGKSMDMYAFRMGYSGLAYYMLAFLGTLALILIVRILPANKIVRKISTGTFLILALHYQILRLLELNDIVFSDITRLSSLAVIMVLCYPLILFSEKHCPILLGKNKK